VSIGRRGKEKVLERLPCLQELTFERIRDHLLLDGLLPYPLDCLRIGLIERVGVGGKPSAKQSVVEVRLDRLRYYICAALAELIGEGGDCDGAGTPPRLVRQVGDVLPVVGLLEFA